jgi:hypothetical protein
MEDKAMMIDSELSADSGLLLATLPPTPVEDWLLVAVWRFDGI